jgi:toxin ParE1/3/4
MPRWSRPARQDLEAQLEYVGRESPGLVGRVAAQVRQATEALDVFPQLGREGVVEGTRELVIPRLPFVCVYRIRDGRVEILRFLHERMQWPR